LLATGEKKKMKRSASTKKKKVPKTKFILRKSPIINTPNFMSKVYLQPTEIKSPPNMQQTY